MSIVRGCNFVYKIHNRIWTGSSMQFSTNFAIISILFLKKYWIYLRIKIVRKLKKILWLVRKEIYLLVVIKNWYNICYIRSIYENTFIINC